MVTIDRILCPVDLSESSRAALQQALALARWYEAKVTVLHVYRQIVVVDTAAAALGTGMYMPPVPLPEVDRATIERRVGEFVTATPGAADVTAHVCEGANVREEVLREAREIGADLIVLGSHGLTGIKRLVHPHRYPVGLEVKLFELKTRLVLEARSESKVRSRATQQGLESVEKVNE